MTTMQVTETKSEGLKRDPVELGREPGLQLGRRHDHLEFALEPLGLGLGHPHLRKVYGRSVMADVVQNAVNEANQKIVEDNKLKSSSVASRVSSSAAGTTTWNSRLSPSDLVSVTCISRAGSLS
jgi:hypothetical protein